MDDDDCQPLVPMTEVREPLEGFVVGVIDVLTHLRLGA
jgi:hypothetical protein